MLVVRHDDNDDINLLKDSLTDSMKVGLGSSGHLLPGLCDPTLCLWHRARSSVRKDRERKRNVEHKA